MHALYKCRFSEAWPCPVTSHSVSLLLRKSIKPTIDLTLQIPHDKFSRELCLLTRSSYDYLQEWVGGMKRRERCAEKVRRRKRARGRKRGRRRRRTGGEEVFSSAMIHAEAESPAGAKNPAPALAPGQAMSSYIDCRYKTAGLHVKYSIFLISRVHQPFFTFQQFKLARRLYR